MDTTSSLSKGCFLFAPASCFANTVLKGAFQPLPGERPGDVIERQKAFALIWEEVESKIEHIMTKQHDELFSALEQFMERARRQLYNLWSQDSSSSSSSSSSTSSGSKKVFPSRLEIPTAVLITGVNLPDHACLFRQLKHVLSTNITPHIVQLRSSSCNRGMKETLKEMFIQLRQSTLQNRKEEEEEEEEGTVLTKTPLVSLPLLCHWYEETHSEHQAPPPKRKKLKLETTLNNGGAHRPPVVVIVEDFEGLAPHIIQDLILSLSPHLPSFPVVLVLGVATSTNTVHSSLPQSSSSLLCIEQFKAQPSIETLDHIIREVFLSPHLPFKLGPHSLHLLLHQFLCSYLSVTHLSRSLKVAMIEHFHWQPLSVLINKWDKIELTVDGLDNNHCEMVRATPSFRKFVDGLDNPKLQIALLEDDKKLKAATKLHLRRLQSYLHTLHPLTLCLLTLTSTLPNAPLGRKLHDLFVACVEGKVAEHSGAFDRAWSLLRLLGRESMIAMATRCVSILEESSSERKEAPVLRALTVFRQFLEELDKPEKQVLSLSVVGEEEDGGGGGGGVLATDSHTTSERKMMFQERLRQMAGRRSKVSPFETAKATLLEQLLPILQKALVSPLTLPLHEVCYFNSSSSLRKHLAAAPRAALHVALSKPNVYLASADSVSSHTGLSAQMPDICIAYHLHLECGHLINLFDWLCAFVAVIDPAAAEKLQGGERRGHKEEVNPDLHARFIQAVSELQLLGFIKPTQRKTDHVQRLTWGAC